MLLLTFQGKENRASILSFVNWAVMIVIMHVLDEKKKNLVKNILDVQVDYVPIT
jgi:hypothetical protein